MDKIKWYDLKMTSNSTPSPYMVNGISKNSGDYYYIFDGNDATQWISSVSMSDGWVEINLGTPIVFDAINYYSSNPSQLPSSLTIKGSNDGINYNNIHYVSGIPLGGENTIRFNNIVAYSIYRVVFNTKQSNASYWSLNRLMFGKTTINRLSIKNQSSNKYYSLDDKTLISLPNTSDKNMILHGIEVGKEIQLDEPFTKIRTVVDIDDDNQDVTEVEVEPFSVYDYISENPQVLVYTESTDDIIVSTTTEPYTVYDEFSDELEVLYCTDDETVTEVDLILDAYSESQIVYPKGDISLFGIESIDQITLVATGDAKIGISVNGGITWLNYKDGQWIELDSIHNGMTDSEVNTLTSIQIMEAKGESQTIRFAYSLSGDAEVDCIEMKVSMRGTEQIAKSADYDMEYDSSAKTIIYNIKKSSTYSVNYVDAQ